MSNYTKTTDFEAKDSLPTGDSEKIIRGSEFETEFDAISTAIATKADTAGPTFTGTATFATANVNALQIAGVAVSSTAAELNILDGVTSTTAEINKLDGFTGTFEDLNYAKDLRASGVTAAEFDILDGLTATATELNILDGATVTTAELNLLDGVTSTTAELNILDGVTATTANLNVLAGTTLTSADLPYFDRADNTNGRVEQSKVLIANSDGDVEFRGGGTLSWNDGDLSISNANNLSTTFNATYKVVFDGDEWIFREADNTLMADFTSGTAKLYKDGTARLTTTTSGVDVTGTITFDGGTTSADLNFGDNDKAVFGAGSDLEIYHDGTHSYISDQGTGNLRVLAENFQVRNPANNEAMIIAIPDSGVNLYHNNALKLATTSTGIDVTGTVTADGLTVQTAQGDVTIPTGTSSLNFARAGSNYIRATDASGSFTFITGANDFATQRMKLLSNGDVALYEDTGTTAKLFWDASAESLGIGTTAPTDPLHVSTGSDLDSGEISIKLGSNASNARAMEITKDTSAPYNTTINTQLNTGTTTGALIFKNGATEQMRIDSSGRVGIGTTSPGNKQVSIVGSTSYGQLRLAQTETDNADQRMALTFRQYDFDEQGFIGMLGFTNSTTNQIVIGGGTGDFNCATTIRFATASNTTTTQGTDRARITSGGHFLVGKSAQDQTNTVGFEAKDDGLAVATTDGSQSLILNRKSSDGTIAEFRKDNSTVGSIGSQGGANIYITSGNRGVRLNDGDFSPITSANAYSDNTVDLGRSSSRFKDLYLSGSAKVNGVEIEGSAIGLLNIYRDDVNANYAAITFKDTTDTNINGKIGYGANQLRLDGTSSIVFANDDTEAMRIDSSGNLLVGKTAIGSTTDGFEARASGYTALSDTSGAALNVNRNTTDGNIVTFTKDGTTVGSIGTNTSRLTIGNGDTGLLIAGDLDNITPFNTSTNASRDAAVDLGNSGVRFKDLYLSGAVKFGSQDALATDGTSTYVKANSNIYFQPANTQKMLLDTSGNLLVGKTSPSSSVDGAELKDGNGVSAIIGTSTQSNSASGNVMILNRRTTDGEIINFRKDGSTVGSIGTQNGQITIGSADTGLGFQGDSTGTVDDAILPVNISTGARRDAAISLGHANGRFKDLYLSGGAYLGGTAAANHLDDYEEGTFTPAFSATGLSVTYDQQAGKYTKVGNIVHFLIQLGTDAATGTSASETLTIAGLPFSAGGQNSSGSLGFVYSTAVDISNMRYSIGVGNTYITLYDGGDTTGFAQTHSDILADGVNKNRIFIAGFYYTGE